MPLGRLIETHLRRVRLNLPHQRAFEFFDGVSDLVIPDNLKSGVQKACRYEPDLNPTYQDLATHYGTAVIPARVRKPKDKGCAPYCTSCVASVGF